MGSRSQSVQQLIGEITSLTGRMGPLPEWSQRGAVVGLEGGTANVSEIVSRLETAGVPLAGVWLQDWVGLRHGSDGDRLIWNWEINYDWYPGWKVCHYVYQYKNRANYAIIVEMHFYFRRW